MRWLYLVASLRSDERLGDITPKICHDLSSALSRFWKSPTYRITVYERKHIYIIIVNRLIVLHNTSHHKHFFTYPNHITMAFTFHIPKFIQSAKSSKKSSKSSSSRASSVNDQVPAYHQKYLYDPMRYNQRPDYVGSFVDPMGGRSYYGHSYDVTNTGA